MTDQPDALPPSATEPAAIPQVGDQLGGHPIFGVRIVTDAPGESQCFVSFDLGCVNWVSAD